MGRSIQLLLIEDNEDDALLEVLELTRGGFEVKYERIETESELRETLVRKEWDCIISDYSMPNFSGIDALYVYNETGLDIPFILVSGTIGEEIAVGAMKAGAHDYIMKNKLMRLVPSLQRELRDAETRRKLKQSEKEKQAKDELFRHLIEKNSSIICLIGSDGKIIFESSAIETITGYSLGERIGHYVWDLVDVEDLEKAKEAFKEVLSLKGGSITSVLRNHHKDGTIRWLEVRATNLLHDPSVNGIVANIQDITSKKLAEEKLKQSQRNLLEAQRIARLGSWVFSNKTQEMTLSKVAFSIYELDENIHPSQLLQEIRKIFHPDDLKIHDLKLAYSIEHKTNYQFEYRLLFPDGRLKYVLGLGEMLTNIDGEVIGRRGTMQDITERKQDEMLIRDLNDNLEQKIKERTAQLAEINIQLVNEIEERKAIEQALSVSEGKLHAILALAPVIISIINKQGKVVYTSSYHNKLIKENGEQLIGTSVFDINSIHPDDRMIFGENFKKILKYSDSVIKTEYRGFGINNELVWFEVLAKNYLDNPSIAGILIVIHEITERKKAELALMESENQLKELNGTKDKFFSIIAHDLKNPFSVLFSSIELLLMHLQKNNIEKVNVKALMIQDAAKRGYNLLQNLLEWAQAQLGATSFSPISIQLRNLVAETISSIENSATEKNISITNEVDSDVSVIADTNLLQIVMRNLITNAIKFTPNGGQVYIRAQKRDKSVEVAIQDTGVGMAAETLAKLFRIDTKVTTKGTNEESGTGLGLILCKEFVEKHGGQIWAESQKNIGSIFRFTIPN